MGCFFFLDLVLERGRDLLQCHDPDRNLLGLIQQEELGAKSPKTEPDDERVEVSAHWLNIPSLRLTIVLKSPRRDL